MRINGLSGPGFVVMISHMKKIAPMVRASCVIASVFAITPSVGHAQDAICRAPARIDAGASGTEPAPLARVRNYRPIFQQCHNALNQTRLAIRRISVDAENLLLMVDPSTLESSLEHERCWTCADTDDETQKETRLIGAVQMSSQTAANGTVPGRSPLTPGYPTAREMAPLSPAISAQVASRSTVTCWKCSRRSGLGRQWRSQYPGFG
jgi:hypothetical protein